MVIAEPKREERRGGLRALHGGKPRGLYSSLFLTGQRYLQFVRLW